MKKLFSSALSFLTAFTFLTSGNTLRVMAEDIAEQPADTGILEEVYLGDISGFGISYPQDKEVLSNFGRDKYCFYNFLDDNDIYVYQQLVPLINNPTSDEYTIELANTVTVTLSSLPDSEQYAETDQENYEYALFGSCKPAIDSVMFDFPELCWLDVKKTTIRPGNDVRILHNFNNGTYTIKYSSIVIKPAFYSAFDNADEVNEAMDALWDAVANFPVEGETRYEQIKSIHDRICYFTYYDLDSKLRGSALGALVTPGVVCEGYAKAFKLICDRVDIPCVVIYGNETEDEDSAHMWNYVQMEDGKWYGIDVTWDDLDGEFGREIKYDYFLKGSRSFNRVHTEQPDYHLTYLNYPEISKSSYDPSSAPAVTTTKPASAEGDLNKDGSVNTADLIYCAKTVHGTLKPEYSCDVNKDGQTDVFDVICMRKIILGLMK